ncbi:MAG: sugar phosphate nucleotidyltransferase [Bacteroidales bacterium]
MDAMIFAAGLGTRLKPITDTLPKALVRAGDFTMLELVARKLKTTGVTHLIINLHHHAQMIRAFVSEKNNFGLEISFSDETTRILDTGGGLKKAAKLIKNRQSPVILHNVDVLSDIDLKAMIDFHDKENALATLFVQQRKSSRYLLFDDHQNLKGWKNTETGTEVHLSAKPLHPLAFNGIHIIDPMLPELMEATGKFSITEAYLTLAKDHEIKGWQDEGAVYLDVGKPESLEKATEIVKRIRI